jgi:hypothetical protein
MGRVSNGWKKYLEGYDELVGTKWASCPSSDVHSDFSHLALLNL